MMIASCRAPIDRQESTIDWTRVARRIRILLVRLSEPGDRDDLDDLVQDACLRFLCAIRRETCRSIDGLLAVIVRRVWIDYLRGKVHARRVVRALAVDPRRTEAVDPCDASWWRDREADVRLRRAIEAALEVNGATDCVPLVRAYLGGRSWLVVAAELELSHAAVRKRWSRTLVLLRRLVTEDTDLAGRVAGDDTVPVSHPG